MCPNEILTIQVLLAASVALTAFPVLWILLRAVFGWPRKKLGMLALSGCLLASVWCLRYAVGYYGVVQPGPDATGLTWWEEIFNSLVHALQTFSMDEDYTAYITAGREMMAGVFGAEHWLEEAYGWYASALNFLSPVVGGAFILDILASCFPGLRLRFAYLAFWKEKYYFSQVNEASVALARSLSEQKYRLLCHPILVFADMQALEEGQSKALGQELESLGGICLSQSLDQIPKSRWGIRTYLLMAEDTKANLQVLAALTDGGNARYLKKAEIVFVATDDAYAELEQPTRQQLLKQFRGRKKDLPIFTQVRCYSNMIGNLLTEVPLFAPLVQNENHDRQLHVTILGAGSIGMEMFFTTYWMGQLLDHSLHIHVRSQEEESQFWEKVNYVNCEIRRTTDEKDPILRYNRKGDPAPVYCHVDYQRFDAKSTDFMESSEQAQLLDSDYFLVALGSDAENISVANTLRRAIGKRHMEQKKGDKAVVAYVVYDPALSDILNQSPFHSYTGKEPDLMLHAVGNVRDLYSVDNVFMLSYIREALRIQERYRQVRGEENAPRQKGRTCKAQLRKVFGFLRWHPKNAMSLLYRDARSQSSQDRENDAYSINSSMSRGMHRKYKYFSAGYLDASVFQARDGELARREKAAEQRYMEEALAPTDQRMQDRLAWLEHRRWNGYLRVKGFRAPEKFEDYFLQQGSHKHMSLKLHPCIVESDDRGLDPDLAGKKAEQARDLLDEFSLRRHAMIQKLEKQPRFTDYKAYDYPQYEFD